MTLFLIEISLNGKCSLEKIDFLDIGVLKVILSISNFRPLKEMYYLNISNCTLAVHCLSEGTPQFYFFKLT